eukprot:7789607-Pyramimonas_sp.AAC.1
MCPDFLLAEEKPLREEVEEEVEEEEEPEEEEGGADTFVSDDEGFDVPILGVDMFDEEMDPDFLLAEERRPDVQPEDNAAFQ